MLTSNTEIPCVSKKSKHASPPQGFTSRLPDLDTLPDSVVGYQDSACSHDLIPRKYITGSQYPTKLSTVQISDTLILLSNPQFPSQYPIF